MSSAEDIKNTTVKEVLNSSFWLMPATPKFKDSGVIYITSKNLKNGVIDFSDVKYISESDYEKVSANRPVYPGDILISMIGTIGQIAVVEDDAPDFYGQNIYLLRLNDERINRRFFCEFIRADSTQSIFQGTRNGSTQSYLKANHIEDLNIQLPRIQVQEQFAAFCEQSDKSKFDCRMASNLNLSRCLRVNILLKSWVISR